VTRDFDFDFDFDCFVEFAHLLNNSHASEFQQVVSPYPITTEGAEQSRKFLIFYSDHFGLDQPKFVETKSPAKKSNDHILFAVVQSSFFFILDHK